MLCIIYYILIYIIHINKFYRYTYIHTKALEFLVLLLVIFIVSLFIMLF